MRTSNTHSYTGFDGSNARVTGLPMTYHLLASYTGDVRAKMDLRGTNYGGEGKTGRRHTLAIGPYEF